MAANTQITIGGVDYTEYCDLESIEVDNNVVMTSDTMKVSVILRGELPRPMDGNEIIWTNNGVREFAGVITQLDEVDLGVDLEYRVSAQSYERWFNRRLVVGYYEQMPGDQVVKQIVEKFCPGFTTEHVLPGFVMPPHFFNYVTPSDAIKRIAQQIEFGWYIDYEKKVHFYPLEQFPSPLPSNVLDADNDIDNYGDLVLKEDGSQKKTRIYLKGFKSRVATPIVLRYSADGMSQQWNLGYSPSRYDGDIKVLVGGVEKTAKRDLVDGTPGQDVTDMESVFVNYWQNLIRLNYAPPAGTVIEVTMYYMAETIIMRENPEAQGAAAIADGNGDGRYEYAVTEKALSQSTIDAANKRGDQLLYKYAYPSMTGSMNSFTQGWRAGQFFTIRSDRRMGGIAMKMYVRQVKKKIVRATEDDGLLIQYSLSFADVPYLV
ncbi:hypothetical protein [Paenibacillus hexagrammi]|uniref:Minor tail protein n=1 Tax=Paenibacillus hexagrammi TaxID=2908839 RepID=A0ABY3SUN6_9BACL|nr:hypothetical protein [Paenibacillus sp. YPD9-1]UJF36627.1 hypothetical protein L0M14_30525 [Paenibacillus sp. YPD9-1]